MLRVQNADTRLGYAQEDIQSVMEKRIRRSLDLILSSREKQAQSMKDRVSYAERHLSLLLPASDERMKARIALSRSKLDALRREAEALSPLLILRRGYSVTEKEDGSIVRKSGDLKPGDMIKTRLMDGTVLSRVEEQ